MMSSLVAPPPTRRPAGSRPRAAARAARRSAGSRSRAARVRGLPAPHLLEVAGRGTARARDPPPCAGPLGGRDGQRCVHVGFRPLEEGREALARVGGGHEALRGTGARGPAASLLERRRRSWRAASAACAQRGGEAAAAGACGAHASAAAAGSSASSSTRPEASASLARRACGPSAAGPRRAPRPMRRGSSSDASGAKTRQPDLGLAEARVGRGHDALRAAAPAPGRRRGTARARPPARGTAAGKLAGQAHGSRAAWPRPAPAVLGHAGAEREVRALALQAGRPAGRARPLRGERRARAPRSMRGVDHVALGRAEDAGAQRAALLERAQRGTVVARLMRLLRGSAPGSASSSSTYGPATKPLVRKNGSTGTSSRRTMVRTVRDAQLGEAGARSPRKQAPRRRRLQPVRVDADREDPAAGLAAELERAHLAEQVAHDAAGLRRPEPHAPAAAVARDDPGAPPRAAARARCGAASIAASAAASAGAHRAQLQLDGGLHRPARPARGASGQDRLDAAPRSRPAVGQARGAAR